MSHHPRHHATLSVSGQRLLAGLLIGMGLSVIEGPAAPPDPLARHGDTWRYRKGTSEPPTDWHSVPDESLDGTWDTGPGGFGYGDGDDGTVLGDMQNGYWTVYARKTFEVTAGMDPGRRLRLTVDYDDGCIVYLDGQEVFRSSNVPGAAGTPYGCSQNLLTSGHEASGGSPGLPAEVIDLGTLGARLAEGPHVLAAHGLNAALDSSDLSLIVDLDLVDPPADVTWALADSPVNVTSDFAIDGGATLTIEAGVEVVLAAGVSIRALGGSHIDIAGTPAQPVVLRRAADTDWGELSATGAGGSLTIRNADISAGRLRFLAGTTGLVERSSIHDSGASSIVYAGAAASVTMRRCQVSSYQETLFQNTLTVLEDCLFEGPAADAVDFDAARPGSTIRRCTFRNGPTGTNTDAIDIGPTGVTPSVDVLIEDCIMHDFSDKGVSVGDGPYDARDIVVRNCLVYNVARGVQVKHGSVATVQDCTITGCGIGLHGFEKAGGTGGGLMPGCFNNILAANTSPITVEPSTVLELEYSDTWGIDWPGSGNINADPLFRDPAGRDYRLQPASPCAGSGKLGDDMGVEYPVGGLPGVPGSLQIVSFDGSRAELTWSDPDDREEEFVIEKCADGSTWTTAVTAPADSTGATASGLEASPAWAFRIRGANFIGESFASSPVFAVGGPDDFDGDGMPDDWESAHGLLPADPADAGLDPDGDGMTNLAEYLAGTDPLDGGNRLSVAVADAGGGAVLVRFTARAGRSYTVEWSDTLLAGSWQKLADVAPQAAAVEVEVPDLAAAGAPRRFYRILTPFRP